MEIVVIQSTKNKVFKRIAPILLKKKFYSITRNQLNGEVIGKKRLLLFWKIFVRVKITETAKNVTRLEIIASHNPVFTKETDQELERMEESIMESVYRTF